MDECGFNRLIDRAKDVIKSGGEWISSMELENALMADLDAAEAAAIGGRRKWGEAARGGGDPAGRRGDRRSCGPS